MIVSREPSRAGETVTELPEALVGFCHSAKPPTDEMQLSRVDLRLRMR